MSLWDEIGFRGSALIALTYSVVTVFGLVVAGEDYNNAAKSFAPPPAGWGGKNLLWGGMSHINVRRRGRV